MKINFSLRWILDSFILVSLRHLHISCYSHDIVATCTFFPQKVKSIWIFFDKLNFTQEADTYKSIHHFVNIYTNLHFKFFTDFMSIRAHDDWLGTITQKIRKFHAIKSLRMKFFLYIQISAELFSQS